MPNAIYSICVTNKNMEGTIEVALRSVLDQIDNRFEVVVVDESSDSSREILVALSQEYINLRPIFLIPNQKRTISEARNISVAKSVGAYCLLHIDCDDVWEPYLEEFIKVFHYLENLIGYNFLLAGQQVNMASRDFLLQHGPYRHGATAEDRDMWVRLAKIKAYIPLDHIPFFSRMELPKKTHWKKAVMRNYFLLREDFRIGILPSEFFKDLIKNKNLQTPITRIYLLLVSPMAYFSAKKLGEIDRDDYFRDFHEWNDYKELHGGTALEIAKRFTSNPDLNFLSKKGAWIFGNKRFSKSLSQMPESPHYGERTTKIDPHVS